MRLIFYQRNQKIVGMQDVDRLSVHSRDLPAPWKRGEEDTRITGFVSIQPQSHGGLDIV